MRRTNLYGKREIQFYLRKLRLPQLYGLACYFTYSIPKVRNLHQVIIIENYLTTIKNQSIIHQKPESDLMLVVRFPGLLDQYHLLQQHQKVLFWPQIWLPFSQTRDDLARTIYILHPKSMKSEINILNSSISSVWFVNKLIKHYTENQR